jgi:hypothetical protein
MPCLYSHDFRLPSRLSPSGLCSHANLASCPSVRTPPLAPTLSTPSAVKPDVPNCVGLDFTEHMPEGLSACKSSRLPMFSRLRRYAASTTTWKLPGKIASRLQTGLLIQTQARRSKPSRLRTLLTHFVHCHHLQDRLISVGLDNRRISRNVNRVDSLVLAVAPSEGHSILAQARAIAVRVALVNQSFSRRMRAHCLAPRIRYGRPAHRIYSAL